MKSINAITIGAAALAILSLGCSPAAPTSTGPAPAGGGEAPKSNLSGAVVIDGSSTVFPIASALVEGFKGISPDVRMSVAEAGTGAGFKKLISKEIDIANASKPISEEQAADAAKAGVEFIELPMAYDGLSIVVSPQNDWAKSITTAQLKKIWETGSKVKLWSDVDPTWPKEEIKLYGPTSDHGSYEYFNEVINGDKKNSRQDYSQNNDYNALVTAVAGNKGALGYVGHAYVVQNKGAIKAIGVDAGKGVVEATDETIVNGTYAPLSRPLLMYVRKDSAERPEVKAFVEFALGAGVEYIGKSGYVPFPTELYTQISERFKAMTTGSELLGSKGKTVTEVFSTKK